MIIPVYNGEKVIERALESVARQSVSPQEVIVVDDGSTDGTSEVVKRFSKTNVRLIHQPNRGVAIARNRGAQEAIGDYLAFLDADDEWQTGFLEWINKLIEEKPDAALWGTHYLILTDNEVIQTPVGDIQLEELNPRGGVIRNWGEAIRQLIFSIGSVVIPKRLFLEVGGFQAGADYEEDRDLFFRLAQKGKLVWSPAQLVTKHQSGSGHLVAGDRWAYIGMTPLGITLENMILQGVSPQSFPQDVKFFLQERIRLRFVINVLAGESDSAVRLRRLMRILGVKSLWADLLVLISYLPSSWIVKLYYDYLRLKRENPKSLTFKPIWR